MREVVVLPDILELAKNACQAIKYVEKIRYETPLEEAQYRPEWEQPLNKPLEEIPYLEVMDRASRYAYERLMPSNMQFSLDRAKMNEMHLAKVKANKLSPVNVQFYAVETLSKLYSGAKHHILEFRDELTSLFLETSLLQLLLSNKIELRTANIDEFTAHALLLLTEYFFGEKYQNLIRIDWEENFLIVHSELIRLTEYSAPTLLALRAMLSFYDDYEVAFYRLAQFLQMPSEVIVRALEVRYGGV